MTDVASGDAAYRGLFDRSPVALALMTLEGTLVAVNDAACTMWGRSRDELVGMDSLELVHSDDRRAAGLDAARLRRGGVDEVRAQRGFVRADGEEIWADVWTQLVQVKGCEAYLQSTLIDLTAARRAVAEAFAVAAEAREAAERRIQAILAHAPILLFACDRQGTLTFFQAGRVLQELGIRPHARVGDSILEVLAAEDEPESIDRVTRALNGEHVVAEVGGDGRVLEVRLTPMTDADGEPNGFIGVAFDVTDRVEAERQRQEFERRTRQSERLASLGQLAGGVAHDFNNLLAVILSSASFATEALGDSDSAARADLAQIQEAAEQAARLTRQLLIVGRRDTVERVVLDLNEVLAEAAHLLARTIGEHVDLVMRPAPGALPVRADRGQIEQVLINLAVNARDAMPGGGTLTIETALADLDTPEAAGSLGLREGPHAQLSVSDTGTGMSEEVLAHVFEPFFTTKPVGEGTGLGLATVYGVVAESGGGVTVASTLGEGTTVRALFPIARAPLVAGSAPELVAPGGAGKGQRILVVEDGTAVRIVTCKMLEKHGFEVLEAATAEQALAVDLETLDLVLTDVVMPAMSGVELAQHIHERVPDLPVLFMSGYSEDFQEPGGGRAAAVRVVQKPFTAVDLVAAVQAAMTAAARPAR